MEILYLFFYTLEMIIKLFAYGLYKSHNSYLSNKWNWLDGSIVVTSYIAILFQSLSDNKISKILISLRPLKIFSTIDSIKTLL